MAFLALLPILANLVATVFAAESARQAGDAEAIKAATAKLDALQADLVAHRNTAVQELLDLL